MRGFVKGDPKAVTAGKRGGVASGYARRFSPGARSAEYKRGYDSGWRAGRRDREKPAQG